jgi:hypothetical protein
MSTRPNALPFASEAEQSTERSTMKVWIDQDLGAGRCEEATPDAFFSPCDNLHDIIESTEW